MGRVRPGVGMAAAEAELTALAASLESQGPTADGGRPGLVQLRPVRTGSDDAPAIAALVVAALALVLLLASANMANLLLASAMERRREIAVRVTLGAGRGRVARQLLTEGLVLGGLGAAVGLVISVWLAPAFGNLLDVPEGISVEAGAPAYMSAACAALLVGGLAGLAPVRQGSAATSSRRPRAWRRPGSPQAAARAQCWSACRRRCPSCCSC